MKTILKSLAIAGLLLGGSNAAMAQRNQPAASGSIVSGIAIANLEAVIGNSNAIKTAQQQRPITYKAQFDAAEARRNALNTQIQPLVEKFNRERQAANANTPAAQQSLAQQAQQLQRLQESGQQELQNLLAPVALSEAYVNEQIGDKLDQAVKNAMQRKGISLVLNPSAIVAVNNGAYNLSPDILTELNTLIPSAQLVPPQGWEPREVREARAAQAAQQGAGQSRPPAPARPQTDGR